MVLVLWHLPWSQASLSVHSLGVPTGTLFKATREYELVGCYGKNREICRQ